MGLEIDIFGNLFVVGPASLIVLVQLFTEGEAADIDHISYRNAVFSLGGRLVNIQKSYWRLGIHKTADLGIHCFWNTRLSLADIIYRTHIPPAAPGTELLPAPGTELADLLCCFFRCVHRFHFVHGLQIRVVDGERCSR